MKLKRLNSAVDMYVRPVLGSVSQKDGKRYMALCIDKSTVNNSMKYGVAREITESEGSVDTPGFVDKSKLIIVKSKDLLNWEKVSDLKIRGIDRIIKKINPENFYFIGIEDPDVYNEKGKHLYFTIAFRNRDAKFPFFNVFLGHAFGKTFDDLEATNPVLGPEKNLWGSKEICFSPLRTDNKIHLVESMSEKGDNEKSLVLIYAVKQKKEKFHYFKIAFEPSRSNYSWCKGYGSPVRIFPKSFINHRHYVGVMNGREKDKRIKGKYVYGKFRPGLFLFNPVTGEIPWVAKRPLFEDPDARTITFASEFVQTGKNSGVLYAHPNDSFVRAYKIDAIELKKKLPKI
ncbi:hypothetical protein GF386_03745 [Candidatus Pacearchaeota archaeon]|nr:hypothetical protein [Candidatus Pacearchaeota archaeon]MBD3283265.1 hypothetical protein [Candidatus Pacearchaeota archaeon]